jgi:hypothetical protein
MNAKFSQQANHIHAQTTPANGKGPKVQSAKYSCSPLTPGTAEEPISSHISPLQAVSAVLRPSHPLTEVWE